MRGATERLGRRGAGSLRLASRAAGALALVGANGGCATALSTSQPAHVAPVGHFSAEVGIDLSLSVGALDKVVAASEQISALSNPSSGNPMLLTPDQERTVLAGAAHLGFNPPSIIPHAGVYYVPLPQTEFGLRISGSGLRAGVRRQILDQNANGFDLTVGIGLDRSIFVPQIDYGTCTGTCVHIDSYERWNVDASAVVGRHGSWFRWWVGPRFVFSTLSQAMTLTTPSNSDIAGVPPVLTIPGAVSGSGAYLGLSAGVALGYRHFFLGPELTVVELVGSADVTALGSTVNESLEALVLAPSFAVMGEF
jgi:hypothetical protein